MTIQNIAQLKENFLGDDQVQEMISNRAFEIFLARGSEHGHDLEDWFHAEKEVLSSIEKGGVKVIAEVGQAETNIGDVIAPPIEAQSATKA